MGKGVTSLYTGINKNENATDLGGDNGAKYRFAQGIISPKAGSGNMNTRPFPPKLAQRFIYNFYYILPCHIGDISDVT